MATALYRRYRPESFAEVIGQDHVTTPLRRALRAGRIGHAYLFSGPRGCGKTTSARILARCLNCAEGPTDIPCGQCDSCRDLATGGAGSLDVVEIDAASHGGVDDARELRERAAFAPVRDRFKVFIIDEAHMVTSAGFNALLKLVEEPPDHVKFVFATTEPDKVIGTIRSRTHHYPFRLIPPQVLGPYLEQVCVAEGVNVGTGVMPLVVRAGGGSARDSMSVLDQLMAGAADDGLDMQTAIALLGFTDTALLDSAITAVAERDAGALYSAVEHVLATGHEPRRFVEDLLERMRDLIVLAAVPDRGADLLPQVPADDLERMRGQATLFAPADLSQCGDLVHETLSTMSGATSPRLHLELLAARLVLRDERAALAAAADAPAPAAGRPAAASGRGGQAPGGSAQAGPGAPAAPGGSGGREEARRIAQEKAGAARQAHGRPVGQQDQRTGQPAPQPPADAGSATRPDVPQQSGGWDVPVSRPGSGASASTQSEEQVPTAAATAAPADRADMGSRGPAPQASDSQTPAHQSTAHHGSATQRPSVQESAPQESAPPDMPSAAPAPATGGDAGGGGPTADQVRGHWSAILDELSQIRRPSWALISQNGHINAVHGSTVVIGFRTDGLVSAFHRGTAAENLAEAVRRIMHIGVTIEAVVGEDPGPGGPGGPGGGRGPGGPSGGSGPSGPSGPSSPGGLGGTGGTGGGSARLGPDGSQGRPGQQGPGGAPGGPGDPAAQQRQQRATTEAVDRSGSGSGPDSARDPGPDSARDPGPDSAGGPDPAPDTGRAGADAPPLAAETGPGDAPVPWGDAVTQMTPQSAAPDRADPAPAAQQPTSAGQRASDRAMQAAARVSQAGRGGAAPASARIEDFAPEPDDPYPPDPEDFYPPEDAPPRGDDAGPSQRDTASSSPREAEHTGRWSDALAPASSPVAAAPTPRSQAAPPAAAPSHATDASEEIPVVEDEGRDSLPPEEPRTYGQNALKRAIAEGRVIHSRPAPSATTRAGPLASGDEADGGFAAPARSTAPEPSGTPTASGAPTTSEPSAGSAPAGQSSASAAPAVSASPAVPSPSATGEDSAATSGSASARAAASWGTAAVASAPAGADPAATGPAAEPSPDDAAVPATSGAALVREAAQASRTAGLRTRGARTGGADEPRTDADPTGGATRDDEDAVVATRNGREIIETVLGGKVLEVIDETERY